MAYQIYNPISTTTPTTTTTKKSFLACTYDESNAYVPLSQTTTIIIVVMLSQPAKCTIHVCVCVYFCVFVLLSMRYLQKKDVIGVRTNTTL